ncbi:MAG: ABC transporter permease, partial [Thermoplasmatota archaeon]
MTDIDLAEISRIEGVEDVMGRIFIETQVQVENEKFKCQWVSSPYYPEKPYSAINGLQLTSGSYVSSPTAREAVVGNLFSEANDLGAGDELTLFYNNLSTDIKVAGVGASPEYIYVVSDEGWPEPTLLLPIFTTYEMTREVLSVDNGTYNELLVTVKNGYDAKAVKERVESHLLGKGVRITSSLLGTEEADYQFSRADANGMGQMGWIFGIIILVVTTVVIYNSMTRLISSQRAYIGVMGALGGKMSDIIFHYSLFGMFMGSIGALLGIPLGIATSRLIIKEYGDLIGLVDPATNVNWIYVVIFISVGIGIATAGALLGSFKAVSIGPREALTSQYTVQDFSKKPIIERIFDFTGKGRRILQRVPLRNLSRHKLRTAITMISLGVSLILVFSCLALASGFLKPLQNNYDNYEKWDLRVNFIDPLPASNISEVLSNDEFGSLNIEMAIDDFVPIKDGDKLSFVRFQAFERNSSLRDFHVIEGKFDPEGGILVGSIIANKMGFGVGDEVSFVIGNITTSTRISGVTGELMDDSFLMTLDQAESLIGTGGTVNSLVLDRGGMTKDQIEVLLRDNFPVSSFIYTDDVMKGLESMLQGILAMFLIFVAFGIVAEVLFISTTVVLNILDRESEFVSLRAIGSKPSRIRRMIVLETLILLAGGLVIGLPLGFFTTKWAMAYMVKDLMYYFITVDIWVYFVTAAVAVVSAVISSYISANHITKVKLVDAIRHRSA